MRNPNCAPRNRKKSLKESRPKKTSERGAGDPGPSAKEGERGFLIKGHVGKDLRGKKNFRSSQSSTGGPRTFYPWCSASQRQAGEGEKGPGRRARRRVVETVTHSKGKVQVKRADAKGARASCPRLGLRRKGREKLRKEEGREKDACPWISRRRSNGKQEGSRGEK